MSVYKQIRELNTLRESASRILYKAGTITALLHLLARCQHVPLPKTRFFPTTNATRHDVSLTVCKEQCRTQVYGHSQIEYISAA